MFLKRLHLKDFRIFNESEFSFLSSCNIFYGQNGVGKTSLLEAIGYLGRGKSFRTPLSKKLVRYGKPSCMVSASLQKNDALHRIGIEIHSSNKRHLQLNGQVIRSSAALAALMPLIWINPSNLHLFLATPILRRQFINWGVFHFKKDFYDVWKKFNKALQQRNIAIRRHLRAGEIFCWNDDLVKSANAIDQMRKTYINALNPIILNNLDHFMNLPKLELCYDRGWPEDTHLGELLEKTLTSDQKIGYTQFGPHRMDLKLLIKNKMVQDFCSQGQHKLISYVFYLAQGQLFEQAHTHPPIFLIDDLPSELDLDKVVAVATMLSKLGSQVFISGITKENFKPFQQVYDDSQLFHVKHNHSN